MIGPSQQASEPLAGYRVLELGSTVAGPFCGRILADFGAEVIKVEPPVGDLVRAMGKRFHGRSLYAASIFRNKALIGVDLRTTEGRELVHSLAGECDVVVENFRPGTMERWGLGYERLERSNPGLVMTRISGFGQDGPYRDRPGYGVTGEAMSGLRHVTGYPDQPPPRIGVSMTDYITGLYAALGTLLALLSREKTGVGQVVDAALFECAFSFMEPWIPAYEKLGHVASRSGARLPGSTPNNLYPTGDDQYIQIAAPSDSVFARLIEVMGREELALDPRFADPGSRNRFHQDIDDIIAHWTRAHDLNTLEKLLVDSGVPASRVFTMADIFSDPHFSARKSIVDAPDQEWGTVAMAKVVPELSRTPGVIRHAGKDIGADSRAVLQTLLGLSEEHIDSLVARGVVSAGTEGPE